MSKVKLLGLQNSVGAADTYDKTKTSIFGRVRQSTKEGQLVIAPPMSSWADVFVAYGVAPGFCVASPNTGRKFELQNVTSNTPTILAFNFDFSTGTYTYIGKIVITLPTGVHTFRGFSFDDSDVSNIKILVTSTVTTATCLGGSYITWGVPLTDFTVSGTTIPFASSTTAGVKGVYFSQYASEVGLAHAGITSGGIAGGQFTSVTTANKTKYWQQNGAATSLQIYEFDSSLGAPAPSGLVTSGVTAQTTSFAGTSPAAYFTMSAQNGYSTTANTTAAFQAIIVQGTTPANFTATAASGTQTVYYMRDLQQVGGVWYFNLATTAAGVAVLPTSAASNFTIMRAYGISTTHSVKRTGIISPVLTGSIISAHSFGAVSPTTVPASPTLNGTDCLFITTNTNLYLAKISELADSSTSWPSLSGVNLLGTGVDIVTPTAILARYSAHLDRWVYVTNTSKFVIKPHQNNFIDKVLGGLVTKYYESQNPVAAQPGLAVLVSISVSGGYLFAVGSATGQRGVSTVDLRSDNLFDYSYFISPVTQVEQGSMLKYFASLESYWDYTDTFDIFIRSANTSTDSIFSSASGGWTPLTYAKDNSSIALGPYFQIKVTFNIATDSAGNPAQINELILNYLAPNEISDNWIGSVDNTSSNGASPAFTAFRLKSAYASSVPALYFRAYDDNGNLVVSANTSTNPTSFEYTSNNGSSWSALGTIPNTVNTTEVRYKWASPPGVKVTCSIRES